MASLILEARRHHRRIKGYHDREDSRHNRLAESSAKAYGPTPYDGILHHGQSSIKAEAGYMQNWLAQLNRSHSDEEQRGDTSGRSPEDTHTHMAHKSSRLHPKACRKGNACGARKTYHRRGARQSPGKTEPNEDVRRTSTTPLPHPLKTHDGRVEATPCDLLTSRKKPAPLASVPLLDNSSVSDLPSVQEFFGKRKRHKTRLDRYERKKMKGVEPDDEETRKVKCATKRVKRCDASKAARKAGEDLIRAFSSRNIAQERLTMKPDTGLFNKGKASSAARRKGLPDLAFSEMKFLTQSELPYRKREVVISQHRLKAERQQERARNEINTYFAPQREVLGEIDYYTCGQRSSVPFIDHGSSLSPSWLPNKHVLGQTSRRCRPHLDSAEPSEADLQLRRRHSMIDRMLEMPRLEYGKDDRRLPATIQTAESIVSWPGTERTCEQRNAPFRRHLDEVSSPTETQRLLLDSGIFEGTGVKLSLNTHFTRQTQRSKHTNVQRKHPRQTRDQEQSYHCMRSPSANDAELHQGEPTPGRAQSPKKQEFGDTNRSRPRDGEVASIPHGLPESYEDACKPGHLTSVERHVLAAKSYLKRPRSALAPYQGLGVDLPTHGSLHESVDEEQRHKCHCRTAKSPVVQLLSAPAEVKKPSTERTQGVDTARSAQSSVMRRKRNLKQSPHAEDDVSDEREMSRDLGFEAIHPDWQDESLTTSNGQEQDRVQEEVTPGATLQTRNGVAEIPRLSIPVKGVSGGIRSLSELRTQSSMDSANWPLLNSSLQPAISGQPDIVANSTHHAGPHYHIADPGQFDHLSSWPYGLQPSQWQYIPVDEMEVNPEIQFSGDYEAPAMADIDAYHVHELPFQQEQNELDAYGPESIHRGNEEQYWMDSQYSAPAQLQHFHGIPEAYKRNILAPEEQAEFWRMQRPF